VKWSVCKLTKGDQMGLIFEEDIQNLWNRSFQRFLIERKDYPVNDASLEREVDLRANYPNLVIKGNDLF
jgi:hypothetical protein